MAGKLTTPWPRGMKNLREEMEEMFGNLWGEGRDSLMSGSFVPAVDVAETDNAFEVRLDAPAMNASDFDIEVHGNLVTVRGERKEEQEEKGKTWHRVERRTGKFSRTMNMPCNINEGEVAAEYADGVLRITLPKAEDARPRKVSVKG